MSIFHSHPLRSHHPVANKQIEMYIESEKSRQAREAEEIAVEALQIGLAFEDVEEAGEEDETFLENPQFDAAIWAFAQMEQLP